jgi:hypothetical protein
MSPSAKAIASTVIAMMLYEALIVVWFTVDDHSIVPGLALVPPMLLLGIAKLIFTEPLQALSALAEGGPSLLIWTFLFHILPAVGLLKLFTKAYERDP